MADNFASYFPVTVTGGTTNPMAGAETVQGQNPQALGLDPILAAIQSQYTPQTFTQSGGSYGAQRFIDGSSNVVGLNPVTGGNVQQPWFEQGEFNLADYQNNLPAGVAEQVASGSLYGGDSYSPVSNVGNEAWVNDPYASLFSPVPGVARGLVNMMVPGAGLIVGAGQGYQNALAANAMQEAMNQWGGEPNVASDPFMSSVLGAFGQTTQGIENAQAFASNFDDSSAMQGYMAAASDPTIQSITDAIMTTQLGQTNNAYTTNEYGMTAAAVNAAIQANLSAGMSKANAIQSVALNMDVPAEYATTLASEALAAEQADNTASNTTQAEVAASQALASVEAAGGSVSQAQAETIASNTLDPIAAMNAIQGWTVAPTPVVGTSDNGGQSTPTEAPTGGYVTDSRGNIVTSGDGTAVNWGTGAPSYTPTENEQSFARTDGYTADVPSASQGGYDPTSGYDTDTDSGGGGGSSKIVCTAMNQSYGFGSYRNAIWLKYSADKMTKAHEAGYHAIFLPLVDLAYKRNNKPVRIALEHIARHRTADLRAEMRGSKRDTLGRTYRFVLEPLCYVVGKIKGH
jgi:hypothetical protein